VTTGVPGGLSNEGTRVWRNVPRPPRFAGVRAGEGRPPTLATAVARTRGSIAAMMVPIASSELAEMLEVEKATAGRMVDRMEKKGWVLRRADAGDRRVNRLHLTQEALLIQVQLAQIADRTVEDALALLSSRERDQFAKSMRRVKTQLQAMLEPGPAEPVDYAAELVP